MGKNGVGKSRLAKDLILNLSGSIPHTIPSKITVISSYSNIPDDITAKVLLKILRRKFDINMMERLISMLNIGNINENILIKNLSDGQKQKLKLISFFLENKDIIILDEITNSLDKTTVNEIHQFLISYMEENSNKVILNITHNLSDLNNIEGRYYLFRNRKIIMFESKEEIIKQYVEEM
ncbi:ATP-binding cassette domain-containing protein [Paenibacillus antibioticophila]|uniref:ATP-binding cassette domain-containing protein n=1 Tax=Paenibacillus antibioticophila TaxID=1274374 RepID=A0A919XND8_9BACL|nr:ATP-binding cassette domain-containing protein [Paenibacillus antibioticophila]